MPSFPSPAARGGCAGQSKPRCLPSRGPRQQSRRFVRPWVQRVRDWKSLEKPLPVLREAPVEGPLPSVLSPRPPGRAFCVGLEGLSLRGPLARGKFSWEQNRL